MKKFYFILIFSTAFLASAQLPNTTSVKDSMAYKPTSNFDWLKEFFVFSKTVTTELWTNTPSLTFDSVGVVQVGINKNPCTISEYALAAYNRYIQTNDSKYKDVFLVQSKWLLNSDNFELLKHDMLGHSYKYAFHDLVPPWYGGLAEAEFMSVLIRYYYLTKDTSVLPLIIKTRNFLLTPEADGGLLSQTPEGNIWIEEYGGSKQERHVLNGFFVTVICMYEYCKLFPDDKEANSLFIKLLTSVKQSLRYYERLNWITYNRGDYRLVNNWYMKAQIIEMEELYRISQDDYFKFQKMLWSTYTYNKPIGRPAGTCLIENYNFSVPGQLINNKIVTVKEFTNLSGGNTITSMTVSPGLNNTNLNAIKDNDPATSYTFITQPKCEYPLYIDLNFVNPLEFTNLSISSEQYSAVSKKLKLLYFNESDKVWTEIKYKAETTSKTINFSFPALITAKLRLQVSQDLNINPVSIGDLKLYNTKDYRDPEFLHYTTNAVKRTGNTINFSCGTIDTEDLIVYYKSAADQNALNNQVWIQENSFKGGSAKIDSSKDEFFQFLVICKLKSSMTAITNIVVK